MNNTTTTLMHLNMLAGSAPASIYKILAHALYKQHIFVASRDDIARLVAQHELDLSWVYQYSLHDFVTKLRMTTSVAQRIVEGLPDTALLDRECASMQSLDTHVVTLCDAGYPEALRTSTMPPPVLYYMGAPLVTDAPCLAVVGSRLADGYAQQVLEHLVPSLVANGWTIVSGGALGVDTLAHTAAVRHGGTTVVVLGSGLAQWYPRENAALFRQILSAGGTLVSSFAMHTRPEKHHFPERNRIIAGLSNGTLVVQAAEKSGALITAGYALEQGRSIFAVPGAINHPLSAGCHALLKDGACMVTSVHDIFNEFGCVANKNDEQLSLSASLSTQEPITENTLVAFTRTAKTIDELLVLSQLPLSQLQQELFMLQLDGVIKQNFAGQWEAV